MAQTSVQTEAAPPWRCGLNGVERSQSSGVTKHGANLIRVCVSGGEPVQIESSRCQTYN